MPHRQPHTGRFARKPPPPPPEADRPEPSGTAAAGAPPPPAAAELERLLAGHHSDPHRVLGAHPLPDGGTVVRARHPEACACEVRVGERLYRMVPQDGLYGVRLALPLPLSYRLRWHFADGHVWETADPYALAPRLGPLDEHLFNEGTHEALWRVLGAHVGEHQGVAGCGFAVWAPAARAVSVVGDFCAWDGRRYPMRSMGASGIFELFVPGLGEGENYKFAVVGPDGAAHLKADPMAQASEAPPGTASRTFVSRHAWQDGAYMAARAGATPRRAPLNVYEVHLGSWARDPEGGGGPLGYRELAPRLAAHVASLGFNALELLPVAEHPFTGSWGYQVTGYYSPTARYGSPDDFRFFVDTCHAHGLKVILDWVPAHFPKDAFALARFDGTPTYEHPDPQRGEHPDWGTLVFDYGRREVRSFLVANALYWLEAFHVDGLRVDAVASMLYLDYSRPAGAWRPNAHGGRENLEAVALLQQLNDAVRRRHPDCITLAEESTAWPGVTRPPEAGGLGFTFKWNMGWMHDTLRYLQRDPVHRRHHQHELCFAMLYEYSEAYLMPLSHDEVVHGKGSLFGKMPGDAWQKMANLRLLYAYQYLRPGKKLLFMGAELGSEREWDHDRGLDWHLQRQPEHRALAHCLGQLGALYLGHPALWQRDDAPEGFAWVDHSDAEQSVLVFCRHGDDPADTLLVALNFTPVPRPDYRVGAPEAGAWHVLLSSDDAAFGGSGWGTAAGAALAAEALPWHGRAQSLRLDLPPLGALVLGRRPPP